MQVDSLDCDVGSTFPPPSLEYHVLKNPYTKVHSETPPNSTTAIQSPLNMLIILHAQQILFLQDFNFGVKKHASK